MIHDTQCAQISQKQDEHNIYVYVYVFVIMKTMCPPGYHHNGFVATYTLGHIMYVIKCKIYIYIHIYNIYIYIYIYIYI